MSDTDTDEEDKNNENSEKSEEEIWCDYRETMYNAWVEQQKNE